MNSDPASGGAAPATSGAVRTTHGAGARRPDPAFVDMGWGRLIFGASARPEAVAALLSAEQDGARDIAFQLRDPHVVIAQAPHELFLDPSHTYRLRAGDLPPAEGPAAVAVRRARAADAAAIDRVLGRWQMVTFGEHVDRLPPAVEVLVAVDPRRGEVVGTVTGVDHAFAYGDPDEGSSLWCLAVDPDAVAPGVGEALCRAVCERAFARGRSSVDLSVMHDNGGAIALYERLGFARVREFTVKRRNPINEPLFGAPRRGRRMNPYAELIVDEARLRGIAVEIIDAERALFVLRYGGRSIRCRESLSDLTSAVALQLCDDKRATREVFRREGLRVPEQCEADDRAAATRLLARHGLVVVKPARGEQGAGISVGVETETALWRAVARARDVCPDVLVEEQVEGQDLRIVVIGDEVVAAALRRPARVRGDGERTLRELVARYDRRRRAATGGESRVPLDEETERCVAAQGLGLDEVVPAGVEVRLRKTANLHTGGTIHDVTAELDPRLAEVALRATRALDIPVVGLDLLVRSPSAPEYCLIEANERPGLANHEPQPTAERFVDLLFPPTAGARAGAGA
jgi:GNAT-family acetyltransferase (TIGR03103 family)